MERYHATSVLSLRARAGQRSAAWPENSGLISRDLIRPRRFTSSRTCATMLTRAIFSEGDAARPITAIGNAETITARQVRQRCRTHAR